jgi:hypothetical protein
VQSFVISAMSKISTRYESMKTTQLREGKCNVAQTWSVCANVLWRVNVCGANSLLSCTHTYDAASLYRINFLQAHTNTLMHSALYIYIYIYTGARASDILIPSHRVLF